MASTEGELEVVARIMNTEHDAIKTFVVFKAADNLKSKTATIHGGGLFQIANWFRNSQLVRHLITLL
jgi:hypothetical protein